MEAELEFLREEVRTQSSSVHRLQQALYDQQVRANAALLALQSRLTRACRRHRHLQRQSRLRLDSTLSDLLLLEGRLQQEQRQVLQLLQDKDDVIRRQRAALEELGAKNSKLTAVLTHTRGDFLEDDPPRTRRDKAVEEKEEHPQGVVMRHKEPRHKVHFGSLKDTLKRHRSSQELHRPRSMETLLEVRHCNSQEYLSDGVLLMPSSSSSSSGPARKRHDSDRAPEDPKRRGESKDLQAFKAGEVSKEGSKSHEAGQSGEGSGGHESFRRDKGKTSRHKDRREKCVSLVEGSSRLLGLVEVSGGKDKDRDRLSLSVPLFRSSNRSHSPNSRPKRDLSPHHHRHTITITPSHSQESLVSDDDNEETGNTPDPSKNDKQYGELAKASSMPLRLAPESEKAVAETSPKPRPRSLPGEGLNLLVEPGVSEVSMNPSPTSRVPPGQHEALQPGSSSSLPPSAAATAAAAVSSESSPFQSLKNVFRRRSTKHRSKKRPVSMGQPPSQEFHATLKEHFKKYDLTQCWGLATVRECFRKYDLTQCWGLATVREYFKKYDLTQCWGLATVRECFRKYDQTCYSVLTAVKECFEKDHLAQYFVLTAVKKCFEKDDLAQLL